jgi:hypothetical protein
MSDQEKLDYLIARFKLHMIEKINSLNAMPDKETIEKWSDDFLNTQEELESIEYLIAIPIPVVISNRFKRTTMLLSSDNEPSKD